MRSRFEIKMVKAKKMLTPRWPYREEQKARGIWNELVPFPRNKSGNLKLFSHNSTTADDDLY